VDGQGKPDPAVLAALIRSAARAPGARTPLLDRLVERSWPGGGDRTEPFARRWVRAWGPARTVAAPPPCACVLGRCVVCN
jgi:hypothetical protein